MRMDVEVDEFHSLIIRKVKGKGKVFIENRGLFAYNWKMKKKKAVLMAVVIVAAAAIIWLLLYAVKKNRCEIECRNDPSDWTQETCVRNCLDKS